MSQEKFAVSLQQDLITLLVHDDKHGKSVATIVKGNYFEGDYRLIVERALDFWLHHKAAPKQHIADLLSDILDDPADRRGQTYRRILVQMLEVKDQINVDFVLRSMSQFIRMQRAKEVILQTAEQLDSRGIHGLPDVETTLHNFLLEDRGATDPGLRLIDIDKVLSYLEFSHSEFQTGIKELDLANIVPMRGKIMIFLAPSGYGKTWFLVQVGKMAFLQRKKIVHITLEIETEEVLQRYYQALFGASKRDDVNKIPTLRFNKKGEIEQVVSQSVDVPFTFDSDAIRDELKTRINHYGTRANNTIVKRYAMRSLTVEGLESYLESLEAVEKFVPDMVIVDYPGIMKIDEKNYRISMGRLIENLRGLSQRRNFALVAAHQANRISVDADMVKATNMGEDWSAVGTADFLITYSQTAAENTYGLARLYVAKARSEQDKFGVLITQSYKTGQFVLESTRLSDSYARLMEQMRLDHDDAGVDEEQD